MSESTNLRNYSQPCLGLYMSLRAKTPSAEIPRPWKGRTAKSLRCAIFGLDPSVYPFLTDELACQPRSLLDAHSLKGSEAIREDLAHAVFMEPKAESDDGIIKACRDGPKMRKMEERNLGCEEEESQKVKVSLNKE